MWQKKNKGNATLYIHPSIEGAIVVTKFGMNAGVRWRGRPFSSVNEAKDEANKELTNH